VVYLNEMIQERALTSFALCDLYRTNTVHEKIDVRN